MFKNNLKIALRNLRRHKATASINILGLAIGMTCALLIFLWVQDELSYDRFHENGDQICRVVSEYKGYKATVTSGPVAGFLKRMLPEIEQATRLHDCGGTYQYNDNKLKLRGLYVEPAFLEMFTFPVISGSVENALNEPGKIILTEATARKFFGDEDPIGKVLKVDMRWTATVAAVMKDVPHNSSLPLQFDYLAPFKIMYGFRNPDSWEGSSDYDVFIQLQKSASPEVVTQKINTYLRQNDVDANWSLRLQPLKDVHLFSDYDLDKPQGDITYVLIFSFTALLILIIACINYVNLTTARSTGSAREVGMRKVVGAGKIHLISRFFGKSLVVTSIAFLLALILAELSLPFFRSFSGKSLAINFQDHQFLLIASGLFLLTSILSGLYPAIFLTSFKPVAVLKNAALSSLNPKFGLKRFSFRKILVVTQFVVSVIAIIATLTIFHQLNYIQNQKLGFASENLIYIPASWNYDETKFNTFRNEVLQNPDILNVANSGHVPNYDIIFQTNARWTSQERIVNRVFRGFMVGYDFQNTYRMELAQGRFFDREIVSDREQGFVINEAAALAMGMTEPVGKDLEFYGRKGKIIGVLRDFHFENLHKRIDPIVFMFDDHCNYLNIRLRGNDFAQTIQFIKDKVNIHFPDIPFEFHFWDDTLEAFYQTERRTGQLFSVFAMLAIFISSLGILGLASFIAERRTKEVGIRKILGASVIELVGLLTKDFVKWIVIANVIACPVAYYVMNTWLQSFAYRSEHGWLWSFLAAGAFSLVIALLTVSWQAVRAASANPVEALRYE